MSDDNELDRDLTRTLRGRADHLSHAPLAFDDVRGKAVSIRRRRRIASGIGVAAAIAVIVPTAMIATKGTNSDGPLPVTEPTSVTDSADPTPTSTPVMGKPHALDVRNLPTGAPPAIDYRDDAADNGLRAYVSMGTETAVLVGEKLTITRDDGGQPHGPYPASSLAAYAGGGAVAWVDLDGRVMLWDSGTTLTEPLVMGDSGLQGAIIQALTGDCFEGGACTAWVSGGQGPEGEAASVRVDRDGNVGPADPSDTVFLVKDVTESGQLIGLSERNDYNSCSSLVSTATQWKTCKHTLDAFSPSGAYVAASDSFHSGDLNGNIAIYDAATGKATAYRIANAGNSAFYGYFAWEDDSHLLFSAYQDGKWSIVRMGVDGAMEYAVPPAALGDNLSNPFVFQGTPAPI